MFTTPWALLALISVPVVVGIYLFRTRTRRREVSGLFLWSDQTQSQQGGRRIETLQFPLILLLELLILALLAISAAGPHAKWNIAGHPTVVILDDSYSMNALVQDHDGTSRSVKERAETELEKFLVYEAGYPIQFILAGNTPSLLASRATNMTEAKTILADWKCNAPDAALDAAISLAVRTAISGAKILVVSDHPSSEELGVGKVRWLSFGEPLTNLAIVHASRVFQADKDRILVEVANLSLDENRLQMSILDATSQRILQNVNQPIGANETLSLRIGIGGSESIAEENSDTENSTPQGPANFPIELRLADDALVIDNRFTLLPPIHRPVRVLISGVPNDLQAPIRKAVQTSGLAEIVSERPDLVFTGRSFSQETASDSGESSGNENSQQQDDSDVLDHKQAWYVYVFTERDESKVQAFVGPYIMDRSSRLTTGLSLDGVVWSASSSTPGNELPMGGLPIISAGSVPLLTEQILRNGTRTLRFQINERLSTLTVSPDWPILIWNILRSRGEQLHGIPANNLRLGSEAVFIAAPGDATLEITDPLGEKQKQTIRGSRVAIPATQCGVYQVKSESGTYSFSVGTLSATESNLQKMQSESQGGWLDEETIRADYRNLIWAFLLATLALLMIHQILTARSYAPRG